ncbi:DUF6631 family protein [Acinetobacter puyangensis]|uniref:DUF6631 family protein n=1 Tax=Acinetobacter puyangensis TaxID=1096779 RepID=UPI003A4E4467
MAEEVKPPQDPAAQAAEDLATIFPETTITIAGETITVNEYTFMKWVQLKSLHKDFIQALSELVAQSGEGVLVDDLFEFFEDHSTDLSSFLSDSIGKDWEWLEPLTDADMTVLLMSWWQVNKHFFLRAIHRNMRHQAKQSAGQTSSSL